jgi:ribosome-binding factor A
LGKNRFTKGSDLSRADLSNWSNSSSSDPQNELIRRAVAPKLDRKALQLCRQIEREISLIISGELNEDRLRDLLVLSVEPFPNTNQLLVTLQAPSVCTHDELLQLDQLLMIHKPHIRSEIAAAIHRKKTPELSFRVINP